MHTKCWEWYRSMICLCSRCYNNTGWHINNKDWFLTVGGWKSPRQDTAGLDVWWEPTSLFIDGHLFAVSSYGGIDWGALGPEYYSYSNLPLWPKNLAKTLPPKVYMLGIRLQYRILKRQKYSYYSSNYFYGRECERNEYKGN